MKHVYAITGIVSLFLMTACTPVAPDDDSQTPAVNEGEMQQEDQLSAASSQGEDEEQTVVRYTDSGYEPSEITVDMGATVIFRNESSRGMWTASDVHPTHRMYNGTDLSEHCPDPENAYFDACSAVQPGSTWSFTFGKSGTWEYHNHVHASDQGTVIVR